MTCFILFQHKINKQQEILAMRKIAKHTPAYHQPIDDASGNLYIFKINERKNTTTINIESETSTAITVLVALREILHTTLPATIDIK